MEKKIIIEEKGVFDIFLGRCYVILLKVEEKWECFGSFGGIFIVFLDYRL